VERLGAYRLEKGELGFVEWFLRGRAPHVRARFRMITTGEYENRWRSGPGSPDLAETGSPVRFALKPKPARYARGGSLPKVGAAGRRKREVIFE
jgi:hypothetical protein